MDKLQQFIKEKEKYPQILGEIVELLVNSKKDYTVLTSKLTSLAVMSQEELGIDNGNITAIVDKFMNNKAVMDDNIEEAFNILIVNQG